MKIILKLLWKIGAVTRTEFEFLIHTVALLSSRINDLDKRVDYRRQGDRVEHLEICARLEANEAMLRRCALKLALIDAKEIENDK